MNLPPGGAHLGVVSGPPEELVHDLIEKLREYTDLEISTMDGIVENVRFGLPPTLDRAAAPQ